MRIEAKEIGSIDMDYQSYEVVIYTHQGFPLQRIPYSDQYSMESAFNQMNTSWLRYLENQGDQTDETKHESMEIEK